MKCMCRLLFPDSPPNPATQKTQGKGLNWEVQHSNWMPGASQATSDYTAVRLQSVYRFLVVGLLGISVCKMTPLKNLMGRTPIAVHTMGSMS